MLFEMDGSVLEGQGSFADQVRRAGAPEDLCALLRGRGIGPDLLRRLREAPEGSMIRGVTPTDLYRLIAG